MRPYKMSEFDEKIKKFKKIEKSACILGKPLLYYASTEHEGTEKTSKTDMAPWSSGQDASLSRWNQGFDSPRSHLESPYLRTFFILPNGFPRLFRLRLPLILDVLVLLGYLRLHKLLLCLFPYFHQPG